MDVCYREVDFETEDKSLFVKTIDYKGDVDGVETRTHNIYKPIIGGMPRVDIIKQVIVYYEDWDGDEYYKLRQAG